MVLFLLCRWLKPSLLIITTLALITPLTYGKSISKVGFYEDTYFLTTLTNNTNEEVYQDAGDEELSQLSKLEIKYQFSLSVPIIRISPNYSIMASYTQLSLWQLGNSEISSPFRETNYQPQIFTMHQGDFFLFNNIEYGYKHQSNGRGGDLSRSWERLFVSFEHIGGAFEYGIQGWKAMALSDNRDIEDYIPPYTIWMRLNNSVGVFDLRARQNFDTNRSGVEISFSYQVNNLVSLYTQVWTGYGETLIDYNHNQTRVGIGFRVLPTLF
jgi:phospholipase A1/A2